jgi:hypothetical protein
MTHQLPDLANVNFYFSVYLQCESQNLKQIAIIRLLGGGKRRKKKQSDLTLPLDILYLLRIIEKIWTTETDQNQRWSVKDYISSCFCRPIAHKLKNTVTHAIASLC